MKHHKMWLALCLCLLYFCSNLQAQNTTVHSVIHNSKGKPIFAALVSSIEGNVSTYTDSLGQFTLSVPTNTNIVINVKGYKKLTLNVGIVPADITLAIETEIQEVNLPFRKVDRKDISDAVSVLNPETYIDKDYNLSVGGGINGRVAGLIGTNNIWGMENALVMIDGVRRSYADITLNEVQQISVLKGINAVALYGSQAAKGIIFITTKRGEAGNRKVSLRVNSGIALPKELPKYLNSADYLTLYNEARKNDGIPGVQYSDATIQNFRTGNMYRYPSVDYYSSEYIKKFQNATDANAEFSGGNSNARFYSNVGYAHSSTLLKAGEGANEGNNRLSLRGNIDLKLNNNISSTIYVNAVFNDNRSAVGNYWANAATFLPNRVTPLIPISLISPTDKASLDIVRSSSNVIDGKYLLGGTQQILGNPLADLYVGGYNRNVGRTYQVTNTINANLSSLLPGLAFHTLFNLDYTNSYLQSINNTYAVYTPSWRTDSDTLASLQKFGVDARPGTQNINNTAQTQNIGFSSWLSYDKTFKNDHNISAILLGYTSSITVNDVYQPLTNSHLALQLGYNYKHKYLFDFTGAYVNSSKLDKGYRTGFSPTASVGWLLSSENFLSNAKAIDYLKLSAAAGIMKTDLDVSTYYSYENIYQRGNTFTWNDGVQAGNQATTSAFGASPGLFFPERKEVNVSLEGSFFDRLITVQTSFFKTQMNNMPTQRFSQYPSYFNTFIPYTNYNSQQRTGFDVLLNFYKKAGNFEFNLGTTFTYATSKVTQRDELFVDAYQNRTSQTVDAIFGLVNQGFFKDQNDIDTHPKQVFSIVKPGDIRYKDQNGDNIIDSRDQVVLGRYNSPLNYGLNLNIAYRNLNLFVQGTGSNGGMSINNSSYFWISGDAKYSEVVSNRWPPATANTATFPRLSTLQNNNNFQTSDFWLYSSNRFNLSKVQLTYNFSQRTLGNKYLKTLLVYVSGANLYTFSKNRKFLDLNVGSTPQLRYFTAGIRAGF